MNEARHGSAEARDELMRRYFREIAVLAAAMTVPRRQRIECRANAFHDLRTQLVNDATEAEDLAQKAFIRAFRNLDLLVDPRRFGPWLRRIVVGVSIDWLWSFPCPVSRLERR